MMLIEVAPNNDMGDIGYGDGTKVFSIDGLNERFYDSVSIPREILPKIAREPLRKTF